MSAGRQTARAKSGNIALVQRSLIMAAVLFAGFLYLVFELAGVNF